MDALHMSLYHSYIHVHQLTSSLLSFRMSTRVLLATLSIPITPERTDIARLLDMDGIIVEKQRRLATLLGLQSPPNRVGLINDMVSCLRICSVEESPPPSSFCSRPTSHAPISVWNS